MVEKLYRISKNKKSEIAENLINVLEKREGISDDTLDFVSKWVMTGPDKKSKAFFDVWEIVLKNYMPKTKNRPILYRSCERINRKGKITSFTGSFKCARKISKCKGSLIICDTEETLKVHKEIFKKGDYRHTFYPLVDVLNKMKELDGFNFLKEFIGEDEYIMRVDLDIMYSFNWRESNNKESSLIDEILTSSNSKQ